MYVSVCMCTTLGITHVYCTLYVVVVILYRVYIYNACTLYIITPLYIHVYIHVYIFSIFIYTLYNLYCGLPLQCMRSSWGQLTRQRWT